MKTRRAPRSVNREEEESSERWRLEETSETWGRRRRHIVQRITQEREKDIARVTSQQRKSPSARYGYDERLARRSGGDVSKSDSRREFI